MRGGVTRPARRTIPPTKPGPGHVRKPHSGNRPSPPPALWAPKPEAEVSASEPPQFRPHLRTSSRVAVTSAIRRQDLPFQRLGIYGKPPQLNSSAKDWLAPTGAGRVSGWRAGVVPASLRWRRSVICVWFSSATIASHACSSEAWKDSHRKPVADSSGPFLVHPRHLDRVEVEGICWRLVAKRHLEFLRKTIF